MVTQTVNLDLVPSQFGRSNVTVPCSQYDKEFRVIQFVIYNKKALFNIPSDSVVTIRGTKPQDNTGFEYECDFNGNLVTFPLKQQITVYHGLIPAELRITKNGEIIGSANFVFMVEESPLKDNTVISDTDLPLLQEALNAVDETLSYRNEAETFSQDAEAWAVGQRNGEDVESDDPTYENNSKYYSQLAQTSEQNAETSATNAENYKNLASQYADNASTSALSASNSATSASESATSASESAQSASDSADRAEQIEQNVEGYVEDAQGYANEAKGYRDTASQYATNAQTYASNASSSATSASSSASNAQTYMNNAQASASQASQSATNAQTFATNASTSATNANASATSASQSATSASNSATSASESATNASTSATNAQTSAESASASATSAETSAEQAEAVLEEVIGIKDNFAEKDGFYPDMSVGHLLSDTTVDDEFTYQVTNYDGKAKINSIKGNTLKWNQLVSANTSDYVLSNTTFTTSNAEATLTNTSDATTIKCARLKIDGGVALKQNHVYLAQGFVKADSEVNSYIVFASVTNSNRVSIQNATSTFIYGGMMWKPSVADDWFGLRLANSAPSGSVATYKDVQLFDLTQMFGSTKADEIYAMETAQSGSGVAYFKSLFPLPYYQYDAGSLLSFNGTGIKATGKNLFDVGRTEGSTDSWSSLNVPRDFDLTKYYVGFAFSNVFSKNRIASYSVSNGTISFTLSDSGSIGYGIGFPISCQPNTKYHYSATTTGDKRVSFSFYDVNGAYMSNVYTLNDSYTFTTPSNCFFVLITFSGDSLSASVTYSNVQIEFGETATEFTPYTSSTTSIPTSTYFPTGMKSAGEYYDEQTNSKAYTRIAQGYKLGEIAWTYQSTYDYFYANTQTIRMPSSNAEVAPITAIGFRSASFNDRSAFSDPTIVIDRANHQIQIRNPGYTDATEFSAYLQTVECVWALAEESVVDVDVDLSYDIEKGGTEQLLPINTDVPVTSPLSRNVTFYYPNEAVDNLTKIMAMIAPVENKTVSKAYTVGQYLIYDYVLYRVTSNIANGGTITVGTNVTATSIASILESL